MADFSNEDSEPDTERSLSRLWRYAALILWMALIFLASTDQFSGVKTGSVIEPFLRWFFPHITAEQLDLIHLLVRKAAHLGEYAILGLLAARAFSASAHLLLRRRWLVASLLLIAIYALSDEYHQSFVPSRTASIYDSLIDMAGGLTALLLKVLGDTWRRKKKAVPQRPVDHRPGIRW